MRSITQKVESTQVLLYLERDLQCRGRHLVNKVSSAARFALCLFLRTIREIQFPVAVLYQAWDNIETRSNSEDCFLRAWFCPYIPLFS